MFKDEKIYISDIITVISENKTPETSPIVHYNKKNRNACDLVYLCSGESITYFDGKKIHRKENSVMFLPKKQNGEHFVKTIHPTEYIDIIFNTEPPLDAEAAMLNCKSDKEIGKLFEKIYNTWVGKKDNYHYICMATLYELIVLLRRKEKNYTSKSKQDKIQKGVDYLHTVYFEKDIDYSLPSELCNMSYSYFKRLFLKIYGIPPVQYVAQLKLNCAKELLTSGMYTVSDVASRVGYHDVYYFSKSFKKNFGITPSEFIKKYKSSK